MEKRKNSMSNMNIDMNQNTLIIGAMILVLLTVTGILPFFIKLVFGLVVGMIGLVVGLVVGAIGLVVGLAAGVIGLVFGLAPILLPVAIIYYLVRNRNGNIEKPKNDFV